MTTPPSRSRPRGRVFRLLRWIVLVAGGSGAAALPDRAALPLRRSGLDHDAVALADRRSASSARSCRSTAWRRPAARGDLGRGRQLLRPSRHRLARHARGVLRGRRHLARCAAARPSPSRSPRTCSSGRAAATCARRWSCRWRSGSTWCCPSAACSRSISTSPNGGRTGSSAPRPARATPSASRPASYGPRSGAAGGGPAQPEGAQRAQSLGQCAPAGGDLRGPRGPVRGADGLHRWRPEGPGLRAKSGTSLAAAHPL